MYKQLGKYAKPLVATASLLLALGASEAYARVSGVTGPTFNLTAKADYISTADGQALWMWGYTNGVTMQYPGPTLIVNQGDTVTINLTNSLTDINGTPLANTPVSIVFPGQGGVTTSCTAAIPVGTAGALTCEAANAQTVSYTFTASQPGTYLYESGTRPDLQTEMGLVGSIIVLPTSGGAVLPKQAYGSVNTSFDNEYLFFLTEADIDVHTAVEQGNLIPDLTNRHAVLWFINGRNGPDTLLADGYPLLPTQPYSALARTIPGKRTLLRVVNAGTDLHPFHTHGNNVITIARDGRLLESAANASVGAAPGYPNLSVSDFTLKAIPGETYDGIWTWTGAGLGWDIYGYTPATCPNPYPANKMTQLATDRCVAVPVNLPSPGGITVGQGFSGGPYLGSAGALPAGESTLNVNFGMFFMWHSHTERELTNNDIFPGGMMTFMVVEPPSIVIP
jgi:manganese oxidase